MPQQKCPVCTKNLHSYQNRLQCTNCFGWIHHGNRLSCSNLTDAEFDEHVNDVDKPFTSDRCVSENIFKDNNSVFQTMPFPVEYEESIFGKPPEVKSKPDISSMTTSELSDSQGRKLETIKQGIFSKREEEVIT